MRKQLLCHRCCNLRGYAIHPGDCGACAYWERRLQRQLEAHGKLGNHHLGRRGQLLEDNQRLEYFTADSPTPNDFAAWNWNRYGGVDNQSWTFQMDISLPDLALNPGQRVFIGLQS